MRSLYGIEEVIFAHFDETLMHMPWDEFIRDMLISRFHALHVVAGHDFYFGYKGEGNPQKTPFSECRKHGIGCDIMECVEIDGIVVSFTYIRKLIAQGDMERAALFLGHPHLLSGRVIRGRRLGTRIGIPTVNMVVPEELQEPARGVYATVTCIDSERYLSVTNVGIKPTVVRGGVTRFSRRPPSSITPEPLRQNRRH
jgi:riboflavin kinase/FMN adenylyltransferase